MKAPVYNLKGDKVGEASLPGFFDTPPRHALLHQVVRAIRANARRPWAHTKFRGEVRGGGRKPWRQKGTGNARHGSRRSPIWVGGGVTHGPRNDRSTTVGLNKKMKRRALYMALASKHADDELTLVENWGAAEEAKTAPMVEALRAVAKGRLGRVEAFERGALIVVAGTNRENDRRVRLSLRNVPWVKVARADSLSVFDLLSFRHLVLPEEALPFLDKTFGSL